MDMHAELRRFYINTLVDEFRTSKIIGNLDSQHLNYHSILYIDLIHYMDGCTVNDLAGLLNLDKSTVSKRINDLESRGIAYKERDAVDGRVYHIHLRPEAKELSRMYDEPYNRAFERIGKELSPSEMETFCRVLSILSEELEAGR